ncbi:pantoate/beta-alanine ligase [Sulfuricella denitrificans skB26]|uniref:Pantothenate synthetase n=1 Tax=Sulfuricella denitrificans (strain DSM 22764 / NBRC 105220 / skB26) TaxID=1163617 RepID=S6AMI9_SULDS|nr:pantoate--beta-alanine ligase [Sulfuricella denitrificans]BAN36024.1 pantoate/beta-alanine ligase [Sulfuricella denitrificans skB26]
MQIVAAVQTIRERLKSEPSVAFVPTMGNLHQGHLALVRQAREHGRCVVVSLFVNPLQFGPNEDFSSYPRTFDQDCAKLEGLADIVFAPAVEDLYPELQQIYVEPSPLADELCGAFRPGHFRGVATVVLKLFNIVQPQAAVFGKKDYQQLHVIRAMVRQLNLPVEIVAGETLRAEDNLALSSRNAYLSAKDRTDAVRLYRNLALIRESIVAGNRDFLALECAAIADLKAHGWRVDYVSVRAAKSLEPAKAGDMSLVVLAAAWLGKTRLIDNLEICLNADKDL